MLGERCGVKRAGGREDEGERVSEAARDGAAREERVRPDASVRHAMSHSTHHVSWAPARRAVIASRSQVDPIMVLNRLHFALPRQCTILVGMPIKVFWCFA